MTIGELLIEVSAMIATGSIRAETEIDVLVEEEYLQRPIARVEISGDDVPRLVLRTPEAS